MSDCKHIEINRYSSGDGHDVWLCRECREPFVQGSRLDSLSQENAELIEQLKARANADPGYGAMRQQVAELEYRLDSIRQHTQRFRRHVDGHELSDPVNLLLAIESIAVERRDTETPCSHPGEPGYYDDKPYCKNCGLYLAH